MYFWLFNTPTIFQSIHTVLILAWGDKGPGGGDWRVIRDKIWRCLK